MVSRSTLAMVLTVAILAASSAAAQTARPDATGAAAAAGNVQRAPLPIDAGEFRITKVVTVVEAAAETAKIQVANAVGGGTQEIDVQRGDAVLNLELDGARALSMTDASAFGLAVAQVARTDPKNVKLIATSKANSTTTSASTAAAARSLRSTEVSGGTVVISSDESSASGAHSAVAAVTLAALAVVYVF